MTEKKRIVGTFALASFLHDMGSDIVFSLWPVYVTSVLGANMTILGFIDGLGDAIVSLSQALSGYYSDRLRKRKIFIWLGYFFGAIARIGYAFAPAWQFLIPFRMLDRSGKMRGSPRDAMISDVSIREDRGKNFGILEAGDNLGAVVGILLAIALIGVLGYKKLFLLAAFPSLLATILVLFVIKEKKLPDVRLFRGIHLKDISKNLRLFIFLSAVFELGFFSYSFLLIYAKQYGFALPLLPVFYLIFTVVAALFSLPFGNLADKIGRKTMVQIAFLFWGATMVLFLFFRSFFAIAVAFIFYGFHRAAIEPSEKALVSELAPKEYVASTLGGFKMVTGLVSLPASFVAGLLWDRIDFTTPLYFSIFLTIAASILLLFVKEKGREKG